MTRKGPAPHLKYLRLYDPDKRRPQDEARSFLRLMLNKDTNIKDCAYKIRTGFLHLACISHLRHLFGISTDDAKRLILEETEPNHD